MKIQLRDRQIGDGAPCFIIAEVGLAHDGSLGLAHSYIEAAVRAGADAVKFQCHLGDQTSEWRVEPKWPQDEDRQAYWQRTDFTREQWFALADHCRHLNREFLCSVFSVEAFKQIDPLVQLHKIPSGQVTNMPLLEAMARTKKPVLLSTGMGTDDELIWAATSLEHSGCAVQLMQCTSAYPCPPSMVGLPLVKDWGGLSDHSGTIYPGIAAAALGCSVLEVHVTFSRAAFGFDQAASLAMDELAMLVRGVRFVEQAMGSVDKNRAAGVLQPMRDVFMVSQ